VEIRTNTRATCAISFTFRSKQREQLVGTTKLINPIRGGTCLEIIPLHVIILVVLIEVISKPVVTPSLVVNSILESLEFLPITIPLPHLG
jgi:hypothetical protein